MSMCTQIENSFTLDESFRLFWETEEIFTKSLMSPEKELCEDLYANTITRDDAGRYITRLPFLNNHPPNLGCSRDIALKRYLHLETRFIRDPVFGKLYAENIQDYVTQGHLVLISRSEEYLLTHHGVIKEGKLRVVFNSGEKSPNGFSLNDFLLFGPKVQADIVKVVTRFRLPKIALTCDIRQMFRAIAFLPDDRKYLHIFWQFF